MKQKIIFRKVHHCHHDADLYHLVPTSKWHSYLKWKKKQQIKMRTRMMEFYLAAGERQICYCQSVAFFLLVLQQHCMPHRIPTCPYTRPLQFFQLIFRLNYATTVSWNTKNSFETYSSEDRETHGCSLDTWLIIFIHSFIHSLYPLAPELSVTGLCCSPSHRSMGEGRGIAPKSNTFC